MNRQAYIRRVRRALTLPRRQKAEILRDLSEIFASAHEHGESDAQIVARLGAPEAFARDAQAPFGHEYARKRNAIEWALAAALALLAALALTLFAISRPADISVIGGADAMTSIVVSSPADPRPVELMTGVAALIAAALLMLRRILKKRLSKGE